jgi:hypothetical protein
MHRRPAAAGGELEGDLMKIVLLIVVAAALVGAFLAFRWFRGDTAYEEAVHDLDEEPQVEESPAAQSQA